MKPISFRIEKDELQKAEELFNQWNQNSRIRYKKSEFFRVVFKYGLNKLIKEEAKLNDKHK
jgi:hypothetical protein